MGTFGDNAAHFLFLIFLLWRQGNASIFELSDELSNNNQSSVEKENTVPTGTTEDSSKPLQTIDLTTCKCLPKQDFCQIAIVKSVVMEISCEEGLNYCCNITVISRENIEFEKPKSPKFKIFVPTSIDPGSSNSTVSNPDSHNLIPNSNQDNMINNTKKELTITSGANKKHNPKCRCKPRNKCQPKYVDYRFGFDCSYSTVRCCEPESEILKEREETLQGSGKIIVPGNKQTLGANSSDDVILNSKNPEDCFCLPINRCKTDPNTISKRKDTLCPYDLVQCCGESIHDEKENATQLNRFSPEGNLTEDKISEPRVGTGMGVNMQGQPAFWQPVQLPLMKIPVRNDEEWQTEETEITTTMAPPQLPTHYYYQSPNYHVDYYRPSTQSRYTSSPWSSLTQTVPYNQYSRYQGEAQPAGIYESPRSREEAPTFLKTIAKFLG